MRGHEDEWMDDGAVYVVALATWMSPQQYLDYIEQVTAQISTDDMEQPWP